MSDPETVKLTELQEGWLEVLEGAPSAFCKSKTEWDLGGVRAFTNGPRTVRALEKKGLVEIGGNQNGVVRLTEAGREYMDRLRKEHAAEGGASRGSD